MEIVSQHFYKTGRTKGKSSTSLREPSSVIMFSGGVDSVSVLKRILEETDEKIYAHHIHLKNNEGVHNIKRYKAEALTLRKIVPYMKKTFRDFHYSESTIDVRQLIDLIPEYYEEEDKELTALSFIPDLTYYNLIGGILAKLSNSNNLHIGTCTEDYEYYLSASSLQARQQNMDQIADGASYGNQYPFKVNVQRLHDKQTKKQNIEYLGKELMDMVWYCRHPIEKDGKLLSCNTDVGIYKQGVDLETGQIFKCRSCKVVSDALIEIEEEKIQRGTKYA
jgi:7-cyano-7-deazaguanine synthase in queuosine biosynthesis